MANIEETERAFKQDQNISVMRSIESINNRLNARLNDLRHLMNDQMIELKYGKGYRDAFMDSVLIQANQL